MSSPSSPRPRSSFWQEKLQDHCRSAQLLPPVFNIVSDRRGGRTAWSSTVTIPLSPHVPTSAHTVSARYWYDGQYVDNAKEDAAEVALRTLTTGSPGGGNASAGASGAGSWGGRGGGGGGGQQGWGKSF